MTRQENINEQQAAIAFSRQSAVFDTIYAGDRIIRYKRERVRQHVLQFLKPGSNILELNAGTGEDAIYFASQGHKVHATDIAEGMQEKLWAKVKSNAMEEMISKECCSFTELDKLKQKGPYNCIFSNFAGLNCTSELNKVLNSFDSLLNPGGIITMVILPKFCLWETMLMFKGKFKTAFRRFLNPNGAKAHVEGTHFRCWYYSPSYVKRMLNSRFELLGQEGLCTIVPPSYIEGFGDKYPSVFSTLRKLEDRHKASWPWRSIGDYYIITFRKK